MQITRVEPTQHDSDRVSIFIDGTFSLACNLIVWMELGFQVGMTITPSEVDQLQHGEAFFALRERALSLLASRPRGRRELEQRLARGTRSRPAPSSEHIAIVLDRLAEVGLLDDHVFAEFWIEQRDRFRPKGSLALQAELRSKGVSREEIATVLEPERDPERALEAGRRRAEQLVNRPGMNARDFRTTLSSFLMRRGFSGSVTRQAVSTLWDELSVESSENVDVDELSEIDE